MNDDPNTNSHRYSELPNVEKSQMKDSEIQEVHAQILREKSEPTEGNALPPLMVLLFSMAVCLWVSWYAPQYMAEFKWDVFDTRYDPAAATAAGGPKVYDPIAKGKRVFTNNCQVCHQQTGSGVPGVYPPLAGSDWVGKSPKVLARIVLNGLAGEITVNGNKYNSAMTPFGTQLTDKEIAEVLSYVRNSWGNSHPIVEESEVAAVRAEIGSRTTTFSPSELLEMFPE